jgi:tRNA U34 5-methylaminomethyl-2-thiouridine-forming methyltransferase MnmC
MLVKSKDGSFTAYSKEFDEHYHSTNDGALKESLQKHIIPAYELKKQKKELHILDICFGLGFNTLATIYYYQKHSPDTKLFIYSAEFDKELVDSLKDFKYPKEFEKYKEIITTLTNNQNFSSDKLNIELFLGDAREYIKRFSNQFDIVYQDAFSPAKNPLLWTKEYFSDIKKSIKDDGVITTYSTALKTRLALYQNGFLIYLVKKEGVRNFTIASLKPLKNHTLVDMEHKIKCNPDIKPLSDTQIA